MSTEPEHLLDKLKKLPSDLRLFVEKRLELFMIETGERIANVLANAATYIVTGLVALIGVLFALLSLSYFLSEVLDSKPLGFGITASLILVAALIIYLAAPEAIESRVRVKIAQQLLDREEENDGKDEDGRDKNPQGKSDTGESDSSGDSFTETPPGYSGTASSAGKTNINY